MDKKFSDKKCFYCGEEVENPNIKHCPKCGNLIYFETFGKRCRSKRLSWVKWNRVKI